MGCGCSTQRRVADSNDKAEEPQPSPDTVKAVPTPSRPGEPPPLEDNAVYPMPSLPDLQDDSDSHDDHSIQGIPPSCTLSLSPESVKDANINCDAENGGKSCKEGQLGRAGGDAGDHEGGDEHSSDNSEWLMPELDCLSEAGEPHGGEDNRADAGGVGVRAEDNEAALSDGEDLAKEAFEEPQPLRKISLDLRPQNDVPALPAEAAIREETVSNARENFDTADSVRHDHPGGPDDSAVDRNSMGWWALNESNNDDGCILHGISSEPERDSVGLDAAGAEEGEMRSVLFTAWGALPPQQEARPTLPAKWDALEKATVVESSHEDAVDERDDGRATWEAPSSEPSAPGQASTLNRRGSYALLDTDEEDFMETLLLD